MCSMNAMNNFGIATGDRAVADKYIRIHDAQIFAQPTDQS